MEYDLDRLTRLRTEQLQREMAPEIERMQLLMQPRVLSPMHVPDAPTALSLTHPFLGLEAYKKKSITDVTMMALASKPPKANIVRVSEHTDSSGNQEVTVRYDRYSTGEKVIIGAAVIAGVTVVAGLVALVAGAYVAGKAIEAGSNSKDD